MLVTDFKRGSNPIWYLVDLVGAPFDDSYWMYVLENDIPYNFAPVYHDVSGTIPWNNPIQFLANGTLPIDIYFDKNKVYRLEFRKNLGLLPPSQSDPLEYLVENYTPGIENSIDGSTSSSTNNQISNGQFAVVNFTEPYTISGANPAPVEIAPGWELELLGNGTALISRQAIDSSIFTPTNAPYALHIGLTGLWTSVILRQRFQQNGQNWQNKYLATSFTARMDGLGAIITARLRASNGQPLALLANPFLTNTFVEYAPDASLVPMYANLDVPPDAYIDYELVLPTTGDIYLTSVQLAVTSSTDPVHYQEDTVDRQIDHLFHYYNPKLQYKQIPSFLVGWDFPKNPAQFNGDTFGTFAGVNQGRYVWDQTIVYQTLANSVATDRAANGGLQLTYSVAGPGQIAVLQYLDQVEARKLLSDRMSVHIHGSTTHANGLAGSVTLWATDDVTLPDLKTPTFLTPITAIDADGIPTMGNGTWTQVPNLFRNSNFTLQAAVTDESNDIMLNGWDITGNAIVNTATYFCIVVGFAPMNNAEIILLNSIGLMAGDIATRPAPKTLGETKLDCQRFFWSTFPDGIAPVQGVGGGLGYPTWQCLNPAATSGNLWTSFYPVAMRKNPDVTFYNPAAANAFAWDFDRAENCNPTVTHANSNEKTLTISAGTSATGVPYDVIGVHVTSDARLGIVL